VKLAVCIVSPAGFVHSEAFREVAETLQSAAVELGHDCVVTTRADLPDRQTIVLGPNLLARHPQPLADSAILYNLEQAGAHPWFEPAVLRLFGKHRVWDYSERNAAMLAALGLPKPLVVPIGWAPALERIPQAAEDIDVLFYGSTNPRRLHVLDALRKAGARVEAVYGVYGAARDALIARSKLVLNLHFFEAKVFEIVRVSYLLANGRAVVSERGAAREEEAPFEEAVAFAEYDDLVRACLDLVERPDRRARLGLRARQVMRSRPAARILEEALWASALA
jgi:hypothetical protein